MTNLRIFPVILLISISMLSPRATVQAAEESKISRGLQVTSADGSRLGQVYRVTGDGAVQIILKKAEVLALNR